MGHQAGNNCGGCSSAEVQALFCELLDPSTSIERATVIRAHISRCDECSERLEREEVVRSLVSKCCGQSKAPEQLRERISIQITRVRFN